jgi:hypothetical protein
MRVSEAGAIENVFEPGTAGDAIGIEPVAFDLHGAVIGSGGELGIDCAGGQGTGCGFVEALAGGFKVIDRIQNGFEI